MQSGQPYQNKSGMGLISTTENQSHIDVYDYCDKMMKDLSHLDKQLENRMSAKKEAIRYSLNSKQNANQILNNYLNEAEESGLNNTQIS